MKFVIFDFCETLVNFQTADRFVDFILENERYTKYRWIGFLNTVFSKTRFNLVMNKLYPELNFSKRMKLFQIRGISENKITYYAQLFYEQELKTNLNNPLYDLLNQHRGHHDCIMIVSGGYTPYIKVFSELHQIKHFFATEMEFKSGKVTGNFKGKDCLFHQKVVLVTQFLRDNPIDYSSSIVYSDSISDLPLLKWADEGVVVSKGHSQDWASKHGLSEIIH